MEMGPPWQSTMTSDRTERPASAIAPDSLDTVVQSESRFCTDGSSGCKPHVRNENIGSGFGHFDCLICIEYIRCCEKIELVRRPDTIDLQA